MSAGLCGPYSRNHLEKLGFLGFATVLGQFSAGTVCQVCSKMGNLAVEGSRPDNTKSDRLIARRHRSHIRTVHRPRASSRVRTSQPQASVFEAKNCGVWGLSEEIVGTGRKRREMGRHKTESICRVVHTPNLGRMQAPTLISHVSGAEHAQEALCC